MSEDRTNPSCPCEYGNPCHALCACANKFSSIGCIRCCRHGGHNERAAKAEWLIQQEEDAWKYREIKQKVRREATTAYAVFIPSFISMTTRAIEELESLRSSLSSMHTLMTARDPKPSPKRKAKR